MAVSAADNLNDPISGAVAAATLSRPENDRLAQLSERFRAQRIDAASAIVASGQAEGAIDGSLDPRVVVERIVGPIWFRVMVLREPVDEHFIDSIIYSVA